MVALDANGQKNILYYEGLEKTEAGLTFRYDADGTITVNGTCSISDTYAYIYGIYGYVTQGIEYSLIDPLQSGSNACYAYVTNTDAFGDARTLYSYETHYTCAATKKISIVMRFKNGNIYNNVQLKPMICVKSLFDISPTYFPPTKPNYELTWLEAADRTSLAEVVDSGAKNLFNIFGATESKTNSITRTINSDSTITVSNDGTNTEVASLTYTITLNANTLYIISGCPSGGTDASYSLSIRTTGHQPVNYAADYGSGSSAFTVSSTGTYLVFIRVAPGYSFSNKVFSPMICTKAAFSVSPKFVPYAKSNYSLTRESARNTTALSLSQFLTNRADQSTFTFRIYDNDVSRNRYRYGIMFEGTTGLPMRMYTLFADTTNTITVINIGDPSSTPPWTVTLTWDSGQTGYGTLTFTRTSSVAYGGIRVIWFN